jgi:hypothetical protein
MVFVFGFQFYLKERTDTKLFEQQVRSLSPPKKVIVSLKMFGVEINWSGYALYQKSTGVHELAFKPSCFVKTDYLKKY